MCANVGWIALLLVPQRDLDAAIAANTIGYNLRRAAGSALGGVLMAGFGVSLPFWIYAASNIVILTAHLWWRQSGQSSDPLPTERLTGAIWTGLGHACNIWRFYDTLVRIFAFFAFASAHWSVLQLVARNQMTDGPEFDGHLLGWIRPQTTPASVASKISPSREVEFPSMR